MRRTCATDGGYCWKISRSRSLVSPAFRSSSGAAARGASAGRAAAAGLDGVWAAAPAARDVSSATVKIVIFFIITLYIRSRGAEVNICAMRRQFSRLVLVLAL